ncbi:MAG: capsid cement protein [Thermoguttaceae bacterium]
MSDKMRWRYGDTNPVVAAVDSSTVIEIGDLVWQDTDDAKPASSQIDQTSEAANQAAFAHNFLGVAMQRSRNGDTAPIRIATTGVFEFDCPSDTFELGDLVGADENTAGNALLDQQVAGVSASQYAIGRVAKQQSDPVTSVLVDIRSTVMTGGVAGSSPSGV